jgi:uncharacterized protein
MTDEPWLDEAFAAASVDPRLAWREPPPRWQASPDGLLVATAAATDFWQGTHYGFRVDNGHALLAEVPGDFVVETRVRASPVHQYDQAGLMVRLSPACWLKTSVEFEPGEPSRLGAVVTNRGWSDWSTQDIDPEAGRDVAFRVSRRGADYLVEAALADARGTQLRLARLHDGAGGPVRAGLYACSPKGVGLEVRFARLTIRAGPG